MKKLIYLILFILTGKLSVYTQPTIQWQKTFGGSGNEYANAIIQTSDGGFIVAGSTTSNDSDVTKNNGGVDYWIVKINSAGLMDWQKSYGGSADDYANNIQQTSDGGYIISGYSESSDSDVVANYGFRDYWIVKTDSIGSIDWQKNYGGSNFEIAYAIQQTVDGGYIVAGYSNSIDGDLAGSNNNAQNYWMLKLNASGIIEWDHQYGGSATDESFSIQQTSDHGFIIAGYTYSQNGHVTNYHGSKDAWVVKADSTGVMQWQKTLGGTSGESVNLIRQTADGGYIVASSSSSIDDDVIGNHGGSDAWIVKLDTGGIIQWQHPLGGTLSDGAYSIQQTSDGGYIACGYSTSNDGDVTGNHGTYDGWIIKLNSVGNLVWQKSIGGTSSDAASVILQTPDAGFIIAGSTSSNDGDVTGNNGNSDFWIVKLDSAQNVSVNELKNSSLNYSDILTIEICDINGRLIRNLSRLKLDPGKSEFGWDGTNNQGRKVENGIYFIILDSGNNIETKKIIYMKN